MSPIRLLPAAVADAIAAGEVVERPASVVKELCENAIDAGARRLDIVVEGGGIERCRVVDDGSGIPATELRLALARHATSKISEAGDLAAVATLGFRGEALASIAAVAEVVITSRPVGAAAGARCRARAAEVVEEGPAACAPGTTVEVRDLFFATPARLRFMRAARAEITAAVRVAADLALSHPEVAITCTADGRVAVRTPGGTLRDAARGVFGTAAAARLLDVDAPGDVAVAGMIAAPLAHRASRSALVLVVNGRRVHNRALTVAVEEAYRGLMPAGRHPYGVVIVTLDPETVDVNVHPAKREVRFRHEGAVFAAVQRACWAALRGLQTTVAETPVAEMAAAAYPTLAFAETAGAWGAAVAVAGGDIGSTITDPTMGVGFPADGADGSGARGALGVGPLRAVGQAGSTWMVAESPSGLVVVDPHAAHEKVLYAQLVAAWDAAGVDRAASGSQLLLLPVTVDCEPATVARVESETELLSRMGFAVEPFGPTSVCCRAIPVACSAADPARLVADLLDALEGDAGPLPERRHRLAASLACHSAVRFGDALEPGEQQQLLDRLAETPGAATCPHGRPTVMILDDAVLRRAFRRPAR